MERFLRVSSSVGALCAAGLLLAGCAGPSRVSRENDRLRARVHELTKQVRRLEDHNTELVARIRQLRATPPSISAEVLDNTPHVARISIGRLSHACDPDGDGRPELLKVYVKPTDGLGRFVQMVGELAVHAAILPPDKEAITIGRITLGPGAVRGAYRSSVLGTRYAVTLPIAVPEDVDAAECTLKVVFLDGRTGLRHTDEQVIELDRTISSAP